MKHFISVDQLTEQEIIALFNEAEANKLIAPKIEETIFAANLFYEPSTRTKMSFVVAETKMGMKILDFTKDCSSVEKGETLYDTAKTFESIGAKLLVVRHFSDNWYKQLDSINLPIINAGAGKVEHPTQCLLDLLTIYEEFGTFKNLNITIAGDVKYSRVAQSSAKALIRLGANVYFSSPPGLKRELVDIPDVSLDEAVEFSDAVMLLRVQNERHNETNKNNISSYLEDYGLTVKRERRMKKQAIIMHPAPVNRGIEIASELVECERSRIFKQMNNGVYIRMAIIKKLLRDWGFIHENITEKHNTIIGNERIQIISCAN